MSDHSKPRNAIPKNVQVSHSCTHFPCQQGYAQNTSSQASSVREPRTPRWTTWVQKRQRNRDQIAIIGWILEKVRELQKKYLLLFCFTDYANTFDCVDHNKLWKILKQKGISDHLTSLLRNLYVGQEATDRTGYRTTDWFKLGKGI